MKKLYNIIIDKLPENEDVVLPRFNRKIVTFINAFSFYQGLSIKDQYEEFDFIAFDGIYPVFLLKIFRPSIKTLRLSFDMTSVAKSLFDFCIDKKLSMFFLGSKQNEVENFFKIITREYPQLIVKGYHNGYLGDKEDSILKNIIKSKPDVIIIGMGSPLQDKIAVKIKKMGFKGSIYTCGGFFHQTKNKVNYYPEWINKYNLRFFYRLSKEPHVFQRGFAFYFRFFFDSLNFFLFKN